MTARSEPNLPLRYSLLERMVNTTALNTKRVTHKNIIKIGEGLMTKTYVDVDSMTHDAVKEALASADRRHARELRAALQKHQGDAQRERALALNNQKLYYEGLARRVAQHREKAEEDRVKVIIRQKELEKEEALQDLQEECDRIKADEIKYACAKVRKDVRSGFGFEKEQAVAAALAKAREGYKRKEQRTIERTIQECAEGHAIQTNQLKELHRKELAKYDREIERLKKDLTKQQFYSKEIEQDFQELQSDYKRFMDLSEGLYHSDFMMDIRQHKPMK